MVPEELPNRHHKRLRQLPNQRFGFSLAPTFAPKQKRLSGSRPKQGLTDWICDSKSSRFDQSRSLGSRSTICPFIGMTERISESPLPSRCGHAAPTLVQNESSPLLVTCQAWKAGVLGSVDTALEVVRAMMKFLSFRCGSLPPSERPREKGRASCSTRVSGRELERAGH
jgi:hypothetical protein